MKTKINRTRTKKLNTKQAYNKLKKIIYSADKEGYPLPAHIRIARAQLYIDGVEGEEPTYTRTSKMPDELCRPLLRP